MRDLEITREEKMKMRDLQLEKLRAIAAGDIGKVSMLMKDNPGFAAHEIRKALAFKESLIVLLNKYGGLAEEDDAAFFEKHRLFKLAAMRGLTTINLLNAGELDEILAIHMKNIWELRAAGKSKIKATTQEEISS
jgi:hypothetical protein